MEEWGEFLVTPEKLLQTVRAWIILLEQADLAYERILEDADKTMSCFQGKAAEVFRSEIEKRKQTGEEKLKEIRQIAVKLEEIAVSYERAEGENQDVIGRNQHSLRANEGRK